VKKRKLWLKKREQSYYQPNWVFQFPLNIPLVQVLYFLTRAHAMIMTKSFSVRLLCCLPRMRLRRLSKQITNPSFPVFLMPRCTAPMKQTASLTEIFVCFDMNCCIPFPWPFPISQNIFHTLKTLTP